MSTSSIPKLFQPIRVGTANLQHRVVLAPMTRNRANAQHVHGSLALEYYRQRTSVPGTLAITEATFIAPQAGGYPNVPGIWSDEQISGWSPVRHALRIQSLKRDKLSFLPTYVPFRSLQQVVDAVHKNGSFIYLQLWALGRTASPDVLQKEDGYPFVAPSPIPLDNTSTSPRALTVEEIREYVQLYATAARNAVVGAGFDGVEIHAANGYLPDQFLQTNTNIRTDSYGGSVENRARFVLEITEAVVNAVGANKVGIRFSPWSTFQGECV